MILWRGKDKEPTASVLDEAYLERLQKHLGLEVTRELMADGVIELSDRMDRIADLAKAGEAEALSRLAHEIAGASGHLGLAALSLHAVEAQRALRAERAFKAKELERIVAPMLKIKRPSIDALADFCKIGEGRLSRE